VLIISSVNRKAKISLDRAIPVTLLD